MNRHSRIISLALVVALTGLAFASGVASASKSQMSVIEEPARLTSLDEAAQTAALDEIEALGAEVVKYSISWRDVAPAFNTGGLSNPDAYPAGAWERFDRVYAKARAKGLKVWIMITAPAPVWAVEREVTDYPGSYKPDPALLGEFAEAVGRRYPGADYVSIWNEVNLARFLQPQTVRGVVESAVHYRSMYIEAQKGLARAGIGSSSVLFGELLPRAQPKDSARMVMPVRFLRDFFCLDSKGARLKGSAATKRKCSSFSKVYAGGIAYHPYSPAGGPLVTEKYSDNATVRYLGRIERVLDQAYKQRRFSKRKAPIFSSEFGFQSDPPDLYMTPIRKIPGFLNISEFLTYKDSRIKTYSQYQLIDDIDLDFFQSGLRFADGTKKPGVYEAYQMPFNVFKVRGDTIVVWGALRAATSTQTVDLQVKSGSSWSTVQKISVRAPLGYFERRIRVPGANKKTFRIHWNGQSSRSSKPAKLVKAATD